MGTQSKGEGEGGRVVGGTVVRPPVWPSESPLARLSKIVCVCFERVEIRPDAHEPTQFAYNIIIRRGARMYVCLYDSFESG